MTTYVGHRSDILVYTNQKNIEEQFITCFVGFYFSTFLGLLYSCTKIYCIQGNVRGEPNHDGCHRPMDPHPSGRLRFHGGVGQYIAIKKKKTSTGRIHIPLITLISLLNHIINGHLPYEIPFFTIVISDQMVGYWMGMLPDVQTKPSRPANLNVLGGNWSRIGHPKTSWFMAEKNQKESVRRTELGQSISRSDRRFVGISIGDGFLRLNLRNPKPYLPLWKIWLRQLGWWSSQYMEKNKIFQFVRDGQYKGRGLHQT